MDGFNDVSCPRFRDVIAVVDWVVVGFGVVRLLLGIRPVGFELLF